MPALRPFLVLVGSVVLAFTSAMVNSDHGSSVPAAMTFAELMQQDKAKYAAGLISEWDVTTTRDYWSPISLERTEERALEETIERLIEQLVEANSLPEALADRYRQEFTRLRGKATQVEP